LPKATERWVGARLVRSLGAWRARVGLAACDCDAWWSGARADEGGR
jgi:hypothetical protein